MPPVPIAEARIALAALASARLPAPPRPTSGRIAALVAEALSAPTPARPKLVVHVNPLDRPTLVASILVPLSAAGFGHVEVRQVPFRIAETNVRVFHAGDRPLAQRVAAALAGAGRPADQRDFTGFVPPPSPGTIEIWIGR